MNDPLDVSQDFIEENKKADLCKPRQKFAPYTRSQRRKRRAEVYRLHFEQGMPAVRIAEAMKVDRNTVNNDLKILYSRALNDYNPNTITFSDYVEKQLVRLESQRDRLGIYLVDAKDTETKLSVERLIADVDFKLMNMMAKLNFGHLKFWDDVSKEMNRMAEKDGLEQRFTSIFELYRISLKSRKKLSQLREDIEKP